MLLAGIIRWIVIDRHGFVPPFLDLPNMQSWVDRFTHRVPEPLHAVRRAAGRRHRRLPDGLPPRARRRGSSPAPRLVNVLAIASVAIIIPTGYFAMSSPLFNEIPVAARKLYYSHHRDAVRDLR